MLTDIEQSYLDQGYVLPRELSWDMVAERRARWDIPEIFVPIAIGGGCIGWGVPHRDGEPLKHP